ncbi:MAG: phytanoyl-CoA dioxygenase family protein [Candidatus Latescibacterota bacterium]
MSLPPDAVQHFRGHGYCTAPAFFTPRETAALQAEVARFQRQGLLRNVATDGDGRTPSATQANLQLIPLHDKSDLLRALPFEQKVTQAVEALIGSPFLLHLDQLFLKPGRHGIGTDWHQDSAYFQIPDPMQGTAMWIAVHAATVANGTLHLIPGSHTEVYPHTRDPNSDHHIHCHPPEHRPAVPLELPAGGVAFFCYGTAHCTRANTTDRERAGIAFHFLRSECVGQARLADASRPHPVLAGPQTTGGVREYGTRVAGTWKDEVERVLGPLTAARERS